MRHRMLLINVIVLYLKFRSEGTVILEDNRSIFLLKKLYSKMIVHPRPHLRIPAVVFYVPLRGNNMVITIVYVLC